jgi:hypothetical protein
MGRLDSVGVAWTGRRSSDEGKNSSKRHRLAGALPGDNLPVNPSTLRDCNGLQKLDPLGNCLVARVLTLFEPMLNFQ